MTGQWHTIPTPDGREVEVLVEGPEDGLAWVFQHGTPSAAVSYQPLLDVAQARELRLIQYSRPGYGSSSPIPGRTVAAAAADVRSVLDHLGHDRFVTVGWSGGGPHALACAALLPERCLAAATLAGVAPFDADGLDFLEGMGAENHEEFGAALAGKDELEEWLTTVGAAMADVTGDQVAQSMGDLIAPVDARYLDAGLGDYVAASFRHALSAGIAGWRDDDLAFTEPWGIDLGAITVPVAIWQGGQDRMVPYAHGKWLAAHVAGATVHLHDDEGHLSLVAQLDRIADDLLSHAQR
ncbi:MAG: alpha/beta fold hydrolase [Nocardioidaceae bacterium]